MRFVATALSLSILAVPAFAADAPSPRGAARAACKADIASLCSGLQPGGGRIKGCLKANRDKLSDGCKSAIAAAMQARKDAKSSSAPAPATTPPATP